VALEVEERAERFAQDIATMQIEDPSPGRHGLWLRVGAGAMGVGLILALVGFIRTAGTKDPLIQADASAMAILGIGLCIVGAAVYLRYSVTKVLRFWLARLSFDLQEHADRRAGGQ
jgi:hypothetical protein